MWKPSAAWINCAVIRTWSPALAHRSLEHVGDVQLPRDFRNLDVLPLNENDDVRAATLSWAPSPADSAAPRRCHRRSIPGPCRRSCSRTAARRCYCRPRDPPASHSRVRLLLVAQPERDCCEGGNERSGDCQPSRHLPAIAQSGPAVFKSRDQFVNARAARQVGWQASGR